MKKKLQYRISGTEEWFDYVDDSKADYIDLFMVGKIYSYDYMVIEIDEEEVKRALEYCPKCNEELLVIGWKDDNKYHITCSKCETSVSGETIEEAETKWNTREGK